MNIVVNTNVHCIVMSNQIQHGQIADPDISVDVFPKILRVLTIRNATFRIILLEQYHIFHK